jgi:hypothetical protein
MLPRVVKMNIFPKRCECIWCRQTFYSEHYYKYGTCSSCLMSKIVTPASKLSDILREAEKEAIATMRVAIRTIKKPS